MELWDAYDSGFRRIEGQTLVRGEPIPAGLYHLVSDILVRHRDGTYLLMRRDPRKHYGGLWEATAGGSALRGETALDCARRELGEETGVFATHFFGIFGGFAIDRSFTMCYNLVTSNWERIYI